MAGNRFTSEPGEMTLKLSQCSNCKNNVSVTGCEAYGTKPNEYALNKEECPKHEKE